MSATHLAGSAPSDCSRGTSGLPLSAAKVVAALSTATWFAFKSYGVFSKRPPAFAELTTGHVPFQGWTKAGDYALLVSGVMGFAGALIALALVGGAVARRCGGEHEKRLDRLWVLASLPFAFQVGLVLLSTDVQATLNLINLSALLVGLILVFALVTVARRVRFAEPRELDQALGASVLATLFSACSATWIILFYNRVFLSSGRLPIGGPQTVMAAHFGAMGAMFLALLVIWFAWGPETPRLVRGLGWLLAVSQIGFPLAAISLMPTPWRTGSEIYYGHPITGAMLTLVIVVGLACFVDGARRAFRPGRNLYRLVVPLGLVLLIVAIKHPVVGDPLLSADDYHFGESLLPFWMSSTFDAVPLWDYMPPRGLSDYVVGFLSFLFVAPTVSALSTGGVLETFFFSGIGYVVLRKQTGRLLAFLMILPLSQAQLAHISLWLVVCLVVSCRRFLKKDYVGFLVAWLVTGLASVLFAPAQGGILVLSMAPLGLFALWQASTGDRDRLVKVGLVTTSLIALICVVTPVGRMLFGAVRYVVEQGSVNTAAHGIPWAMPGSQLWPLFEVSRSAFVLVALLAVYLVARAVVDSRLPRRTAVLTYGITILLLLLLFIPSSAGRIDPGYPSRLARTTHLAAALLAPLLLSLWRGKRDLHWVALLLVVSGAVFAAETRWSGFVNQPLHVVNAEGLVEGESLGMPGLGKVVFQSKEHRARIVAVNAVLKRALAETETYLDLTSRNSHYRFFERPVPITVGAVYNLSSEPEQKRAVLKLSERPPPLVLAWADNLHQSDGGPPSLRAHYLYRFVLDNYRPIKIGRYSWLASPGLVKRLRSWYPGRSANGGAASRRFEESRIWNLLYRKENLLGLPGSWGRSSRSLERKMTAVADLDRLLADQAGLERDDRGYFLGGKDGMALTINLSSLRLSGKGADLLLLNLEMPNEAARDSRMRVSWTTREKHLENWCFVDFRAESGPQVVPLDSVPAWRLSKRIRALHLELVESPGAPHFSLSGVRLAKRGSE